MANEVLKRDQNHITVLAGVTDDASQEIRMFRVDPVTGRLKLSITGIAVSATVDVGTTTTGAPGTDASVVNSGTTSAAIFDFTIPRGDKGDQGDPGDAGQVGMTWEGTYNAGTAYDVDDAVAYNGSSYICIQAGTGQTPDPAGTAYWSVLALKGTNGIDGTDGISFTPKGAYDALTEYVANDVVSYLGSTWIALQTTTGNTPQEGTYWTLNAAKETDHGSLTGLGDDDHPQYVLGVNTHKLTVSATEPTSPSVGDLWVQTS